MRLFLSVPVPSTIAPPPAYARLRERFPEGRWTSPAQWHITLKFLGETPSAGVDAVLMAARAVARRTPSFEIALGSFGVFPENPDVLWAGVETGKEPLTRLARDLESVLEPLGFPAEKRGFQPHVTLARFKPPLRNLPSELPPLWIGGFQAKEMDLMESRLGRDGSTYRCVERMALGSVPERHS